MMDTKISNNKHRQLKLIRSELKLSLQHYTAANNPYDYPQRHPHNPNHPSPGYFPSKTQLTKTHLRPYHLQRSSRSKNKKLALRRKIEGSGGQYAPLQLEGSRIKIRRNNRGSAFSAHFSRHQLLRFFKTPPKKSPLLINTQHPKRAKPQENDNVVICDVFCPLQRQSQQMGHFREYQQTSSRQHSNQISNICGWSSETAQKQLNLALQDRAVSQNSIAGNIENSAQTDPNETQNNLDSQSGQSSQAQTLTQQQSISSNKTFLPMYSIAIIAPSLSSVGQTPNLPQNLDPNVQNQPSIKCMSSSQHISNSQSSSSAQQPLSSGYSLKKISRKDTAKKVPIAEQLKLTDTVKQSDQKEKSVVRQSQPNNSLCSSVPQLHTLRSHFDSRNRIQMGQGQQQAWAFGQSFKTNESQMFSGLEQSNHSKQTRPEICMRKDHRSIEDKENICQSAVRMSKLSEDLENQRFVSQGVDINLSDPKP